MSPLLHALERGPEVVPDVVDPARLVELLGSDRRRVVSAGLIERSLSETQRQGRGRQRDLFARLQNAPAT